MLSKIKPDVVVAAHVRNRISFGRSETDLSSGVVGEHNLDFESDDTLSEHDVSDGGVDVLGDGVTGVDHESVGELHGLRSLTSQFARDYDFATLKLIFIIPDLLLFAVLKSRGRKVNTEDGFAYHLGSRLHDESEDTVGSSSDGKTTLKLVSEGFALGDGAETSVGDLLGEELDGAVLDLESLLDQSGQFSNSLGLVPQNVLGSSGEDDDFSSLKFKISNFQFKSSKIILRKDTKNELE